VFRGINNATLDSKGRMALPARSRETVQLVGAGNVVVTIDMRERCLLLYPLAEWEVVQRKLEGLSNIDPQARRLQRLLIGHATDLCLDSNGRILLPSLLRDYADLDKKLVLVGQGNKVEIWSADQWQERMVHWLSEDESALLQDSDAFTGLSV
jgi:MraZ protein